MSEPNFSMPADSRVEQSTLHPELEKWIWALLPNQKGEVQFNEKLVDEAGNGVSEGK